MEYKYRHIGQNVHILKDHSLLKISEEERFYKILTGKDEIDYTDLESTISALPGILGKVSVNDLSILDLIENGHRMDAVILYRDRSRDNISLMDARNYIEKLDERLRLSIMRNNETMKYVDLDDEGLYKINLENNAIKYNGFYFYADEIDVTKKGFFDSIRDLYASFIEEYTKLNEEKEKFLNILNS